MTLGLACIMFSAAPLFAEENTSARIEPFYVPSLIPSLRIKGPLDFCGEPVPLRDDDVQERLEKELVVLLWMPYQTVLWIKRAGRYLPYIEEALKENNIPNDFKYMAIIESALRPHIGSSAGAVGFWQFMRPTGIKYGLRIDREVDERRSLYASTQAAIRYIKDLYDEFGSWTLAAAAYNMGETGLRARIAEQKTNNYYKLYLNLEAQYFVPKILCAKLVMSQPEKYGFNLGNEDLYPPYEFDRVKLNFSHSIPLQNIAEASGTYFKVIKDLNPEIRGSNTPKGWKFILIPKGSAKYFHARLREITKGYQTITAKKELGNKHVYTVQKGDSLSMIADNFRVSLMDLLEWNRLSIHSTIHPGDQLVLYPD